MSPWLTPQSISPKNNMAFPLHDRGWLHDVLAQKLLYLLQQIVPMLNILHGFMNLLRRARGTNFRCDLLRALGGMGESRLDSVADDGRIRIMLPDCYLYRELQGIIQMSCSSNLS
jgi:hypothetical protein